MPILVGLWAWWPANILGHPFTFIWKTSCPSWVRSSVFWVLLLGYFLILWGIFSSHLLRKGAWQVIKKIFFLNFIREFIQNKMIYVPVVSLYSLEKRWSQLRVIHAPKWFLWWSWTECLLFPPLAYRHWLLWGHSGMRGWHGAWELGPVLTSWVFCSMMGCRQEFAGHSRKFWNWCCWDSCLLLRRMCADPKPAPSLGEMPALGVCRPAGRAGSGAFVPGSHSESFAIAVLGAQPGQESK